MTGIIRFPNLGITLNDVPRWFSIAGFEIACYGIVLAFAMVTGLFLVMKIADYTGQNGDDYFDLGIITLLVSILGARIYYVIFSWDYYSQNLHEILNLRQGGLAIYGGVLFGTAAVAVFCRKRRIRWRKGLDTIAPGLVWGQMIGRWGNFFNREAFGDYADGLLAMQIPVDDIRMNEITSLMSEHLAEIDGITYVQVHPTFLYESLWNMCVLVILLVLIFKMKKRFEGMIAVSYFLLYGIGRFWIEALRTDQLLIPGTALPVSQVLSGALVVGAMLLLIAGFMRERKNVI